MNLSPWAPRAFALALALPSIACSKGDANEAAQGAPLPSSNGCIAATLEHHEHTDDQDGVAHDVRYKERFVRCGGRVWRERVLPRGVPKDAAHARANDHREMPPSFTLARFIEKSSDGATLSLVSRAQRRIIAISPESYEATQFDADFDAAAHLIGTRSIATMTPIPDRSAPAGAEWRSRSSAAGVVRVLWSKLYEFPLEIESESGGGTKLDSLKVVLEPPPVASDLPWADVGGYQKERDTDFMD
ncbi:hypothetical protein [Pendulispora albinea]|uniref:Uncharacterized protein n=1 Tax=Pendulispora albinea TaxID=2741071 RepID=A0ABZ2LT29_9BACT